MGKNLTTFLEKLYSKNFAPSNVQLNFGVLGGRRGGCPFLIESSESLAVPSNFHLITLHIAQGRFIYMFLCFGKKHLGMMDGWSVCVSTKVEYPAHLHTECIGRRDGGKVLGVPEIF